MRLGLFFTVSWKGSQLKIDGRVDSHALPDVTNVRYHQCYTTESSDA